MVLTNTAQELHSHFAAEHTSAAKPAIIQRQRACANLLTKTIKQAGRATHARRFPASSARANPALCARQAQRGHGGTGRPRRPHHHATGGRTRSLSARQRLHRPGPLAGLRPATRLVNLQAFPAPALRQATHFVEIRKQLFHQRKKTARLGRGHESPPVRSNNGNPNCSSACLSVRLTAGWVMLIRRAAPLTLPVTITALKTSMWRRRIDGRPLNFPRCRAPAAPWPCGTRQRLRGLHCPACGTLRANTCCV